MIIGTPGDVAWDSTVLQGCGLRVLVFICFGVDITEFLLLFGITKSPAYSSVMNMLP